MTSNVDLPSKLKGAIALIAKCPIPGKSKTRLIPLLGLEGSTKLAKSMLSDVVLTLDTCSALDDVHKILFYAPGNDDGRQRTMELLKNDLGVKISEEQDDGAKLTTIEGTLSPRNEAGSGWILLPLLTKTDLQASDLGDLLEYALERARQYTNGGVVFLGMDSPVLPLEDIVTGLSLSLKENKNEALLCPADDGGYGMLCVPPQAKVSLTFANMLWSHSLTAVSQMKALTDMGISVKIGRIMHDIDEPDDVRRLCERLTKHDDDDNNSSNSSEGSDKATNDAADRTAKMVLDSSAKTGSLGAVQSTHPWCFHTRKALIESGQLAG